MFVEIAICDGENQQCGVFLLECGQNHNLGRKNPMFEANIQGIRSQAA